VPLLPILTIVRRLTFVALMRWMILRPQQWLACTEHQGKQKACAGKSKLPKQFLAQMHRLSKSFLTHPQSIDSVPKVSLIPA
jgi:hypothetical protein